jgi:hypothetical protein
MRSLRSVFEYSLTNPKVTSGASALSRITIKFVVAADAPGDTANADRSQAVDAVAQAMETVNALSTPATVGIVSSAVDAEPNVVSAVQTIDSVWGGLLERIELFHKIVAGIAEVF